MHTGLGEITPKNILSTQVDTLRSFGISSLKLERIINFSHLVESKELDLDKLYLMKDEEAIKTLISIPGVGLWTAEMILLFCMQRKNIFSRQDLGINKGLSILYHHEKISKALFEKYRKRFSPFGSIASLYLWE
ncbi:MAG: DNA-3-methyladenine glycosylase 2 family protein, partial [Prevotella sp.]|nr:DNA-3-methyladenine glycosylase 2 family protein [Prevotella sp.]